MRRKDYPSFTAEELRYIAAEKKYAKEKRKQSLAELRAAGYDSELHAISDAILQRDTRKK